MLRKASGCGRRTLGNANAPGGNRTRDLHIFSLAHLRAARGRRARLWAEKRVNHRFVGWRALCSLDGISLPAARGELRMRASKQASGIEREREKERKLDAHRCALYSLTSLAINEVSQSQLAS